MVRPKIYKENGLWYCKHLDIIGTGSNPVESFINYIVQKMGKNSIYG